MAYEHLVSDFPVAKLKPGDTFVSTDWVYAFIVIDPAKFGFVPESDKVYAWSLVEDAGAILVHGQSVKKIEMYHYTFED